VLGKAYYGGLFISLKGGIMTKKSIQEIFIALINSCVEGYTGEWDSSGEGKEGFISMKDLLEDLAKYFKIDISKELITP